MTELSIDYKDLSAKAKEIGAMIPPKSFLASRTIQGISLLFLLETAEIMTGDPFSVNGLIKVVLLLSGTAIAANGRFRITEAPISVSGGFTAPEGGPHPGTDAGAVLNALADEAASESGYDSVKQDA